jgi:hypothetical protein
LSKYFDSVIWKIDLARPRFGKIVCQNDLGFGVLANQFGKSVRQTEFVLANRFGKSVWQMSSNFNLVGCGQIVVRIIGWAPREHSRFC